MAQRSSNENINYWNNNRLLEQVPKTIDDITELFGDVTGLTSSATWTVDLIDAQTIDVYSPQDLYINSKTAIVTTGSTLSIQVNDSDYTLSNLITQGDKITFSANTGSVHNLGITY